MGLDQYIGELLYRYNCVIVPGFGAFLTQMKSAVLDEKSHSFSPPTKVISFNEQLSSHDGLLVSYMADAESMSYEKMLHHVEDMAQQWKKQLHKGQRISLPHIGTLKLSREEKILFQPSKSVNYLTSSFGLSSFVSQLVLREELKQEVAVLEEKIPFIITPEKRETASWRPYLKYAAILLLALSTGLTGYRVYEQDLLNTQIVNEQAQERVSKNIQEATFFNTAPFELPVLTVEIAKKDTGVQHHIIAGAFRVRKNAEKKVTQLQAKGYNAQYIGINKHGFHQVTYATFNNAPEANTYLKEIKRTVSKDAWMLSVR